MNIDYEIFSENVVFHIANRKIPSGKNWNTWDTLCISNQFAQNRKK